MPIPVECEECGKKYRMPDRLAGRVVSCKNCGWDIEVTDRSARKPPSRRKPKRSSKSSGNGSPVIIGGAVIVAGALLIAGLVVLFGSEESPQEPQVADSAPANRQPEAISFSEPESALVSENELPSEGAEVASSTDSQEKTDAIYAARMAQLKDKFKRIAIAWHNCSEVHRQFGSDFAKHYGDNGRTLVSWRVHLLPYLGHADLYEQFKLDEPWDSSNNLPLLDKMPDIFRSIGDSQGSTTTRFRGVESVLKSADGKPETMFMVWPEQLTPFASKRAIRLPANEPSGEEIF